MKTVIRMKLIMDSNMDIKWWSTIDFVIILEGYIQRNTHISVYYAVGQRWNGTMFILAIPPVGNAPAGTRFMKYTCVSCGGVISFRWPSWYSWSPVAIADIKPGTFYGFGERQRWTFLTALSTLGGAFINHLAKGQRPCIGDRNGKKSL